MVVMFRSVRCFSHHALLTLVLIVDPFAGGIVVDGGSYVPGHLYDGENCLAAEIGVMVR